MCQLGGAYGSKYKRSKICNVSDGKPECKLIGEDGNIFNLMALASRTLKQHDMEDKADEMCDRITNDANNYYEALAIIGEYVTVI